MKALVVASTFPASDADEAPAFVKQLVVELVRAVPELKIDVLAPQWRDRTPPFVHHEHYDEYRFAYCWPRSCQQLAGRGIVPSLQARPVLSLLLPFLFLFEGVAMWRHVKRHRPDVIYAHWFTPQGVVAAVVSRLTGVPYVLTSHANDVRVWRKVPLIGRVIVRRCLPRARRITAVSRATYDKMRAFFSAQEWAEIAPRVAILPMGVDVAALAAAGAPDVATRAEHGLDGRRVVYFIGRLVEKKGVAFLLDAFTRLSRDAKHHDVVLVIAGDGPLRATLEEQARLSGLGADVVRFVGYVSGQRKLDMFRLADVVVVPSIETVGGDSEGFPVVVMEALAAGKICVATDAAYAEGVLTDGISGFVVPQKDADALASALTRALALSSEAREALLREGRAAVASLDWPVIAKRHHDFLFAPPSLEATSSTSAR